MSRPCVIEQARLPLNVFQYSVAISACQHGGQWAAALGLLATMQQVMVEATAVTCNAAVSACQKAGRWELAVGLLMAMGARALEAGTVSYGASISACEKGRQWEMAIALVAGMEVRRVLKDAFTLNAGISACEKCGQWSAALALFASMVGHRIAQETISYNAAISACARGGWWQKAFELFASMAEHQVPRSTITYSATICACGAGGQWQAALALFTAMQREVVQVDAITCSAIVSACESGGRWEAALDILAVMAKAELKVCTVACSAAISACEKGGRWEASIALFARMLSGRIEADSVVYNALFCACDMAEAWQTALALLELKPKGGFGSTPRGLDYGFVISACMKAGLWGRGILLLEDCRTALLEREQRLGRLGNICDEEGSGHPPEGAAAGTKALNILHKADGVVAVEKAPGPTTEEVLAQLHAQLTDARGHRVPVTSVSRLDGMTSGVLVAARGPESSAAAQFLLAQFCGRLVQKRYLCLSWGALGMVGSRGELSSRLHTEQVTEDAVRSFTSPMGKEAYTSYEVLALYAAPHASCYTLLDVRPKTGRTHQIRAHLARIGRPLAADAGYGQGMLQQQVWARRLFLHCRRIRLQDLAGQPFEASSPLPTDLVQSLGALRHCLDPRRAAAALAAYGTQGYPPPRIPPLRRPGKRATPWALGRRVQIRMLPCRVCCGGSLNPSRAS